MILRQGAAGLYLLAAIACGQAPGQAAPRVAAGDVVPVYREPMYDGPPPLVIYESDWR
jgi:hypothetical protein